jgi:sugar phosphate isomerase/epimerase
MRPCISQATTLSTPFADDVTAYSRAGWSAVELWLTKLETYLETHNVAEARRLLDGEGLKAVAASFQGGLLLAQGAERTLHWDDFRRRLELLGALGVPLLIVAADYATEPRPATRPRARSRRAAAAAAGRAAGVRLALEFQKTTRFCSSLDTALALVEQAGTDWLGVCLDVFHYYTGPSKFEDLAYLSPASLGWVQLCDVSGTPRELASDSDRVLPGDGDFLLGPILDQVAAMGYNGYVSLEVLNPRLWEIPTDRVADVGRQALVRSLGRWAPADASGGI